MSKQASRIALVTGASSGIGMAFARALAARGDDVVLVARRGDRLEALAAELRAAHGVDAFALPCDLARPEAADELHQACEARGIEIDLLVNNAGIGYWEPFSASSRAHVSAQLALNVVALTTLTHAFMPAMLARGRGGVIHVASTAAFQPLPYSAVYAASKAYVLSLSEAMAEETAPHGVSVLCVCPGPTDSEIHGHSGVKPWLLQLSAPMPAEAVAASALAALAAERRVDVPGWRNALGASVARVLPRRLTAFVVERIFRPD